MADTKISDLSAATILQPADQIPLARSGTTLRAPGSLLGSVLLHDETLSSDQATLNLASIPATYRHLRIVADLRGATAATQIEMYVRFNNDSGATYDGFYFYWLSSNASGTAQEAAGTKGLLGLITANTADAGAQGACEILIPNYAGTTFWKMAKCDNAYTRGVVNVTDRIRTFGESSWRSTAAINRVTLLPGTGDWETGSRWTVYGL